MDVKVRKWKQSKDRRYGSTALVTVAQTSEPRMNQKSSKKGWRDIERPCKRDKTTIWVRTCTDFQAICIVYSSTCGPLLQKPEAID